MERSALQRAKALKGKTTFYKSFVANAKTFTCATNFLPHGMHEVDKES